MEDKTKRIQFGPCHIHHTKRNLTPGHINNVNFPEQEVVMYLGLHLDRRLTWRKHIFTIRKHRGMALTKMHSLLGRKSKLSTSNKILIYKAVLKPIWTYGIQLWDAAFTSNVEFLQCFQSKFLRMIEDTSWYMPNTVIGRDLKTQKIEVEIRLYSSQYSALLSAHPNDLVVKLMAQPDNRQLRRHMPKDLRTGF
jgi:hypothetical protein